MVNAPRHKAKPFSAQAGQENWITTLVLYAMYLTSGPRCRKLQRTQTSDNGISFPPAMAPNNPGAAPPFQNSVSDRWIPSNNLRTQRCSSKFTMCDANFQCCIHTQYDQGFGPTVCVKVRARSLHRWKISCHSRDLSLSDGGDTHDRQSFRKRTSSA